MKLHGVLIKSDRAIEAERDNRFPMTKARKKLRQELRALGVEATLYGCQLLLSMHGDAGEWHHISKFAREVDYYDVDSVVERFAAPTEELLQIAKSSKPKRKTHEPMKVSVKLKYRDYISANRYRIKHYQGSAKVAGDWIEFGGRKKRLSGKFLEVKYLPEKPVEQST